LVNIAPGELKGQLRRIDADDAGFDSGRDHLANELCSIRLPDGKEWRQAVPARRSSR
jgi:hypothetical protein